MIGRLIKTAMSRKDKPVLFWKNVQKGEDYECWLWKGEVDILSGFGISRSLVSGGDVVRQAHRIAYILSFGTVPDHHTVRHKCRNRLCCNPGHLIAMRKHPEEEDEYIVTHYYYDSVRTPRLSDFEKRRIKDLREEGQTLRSIANHFKVSVSTVSRAIRGR